MPLGQKKERICGDRVFSSDSEPSLSLDLVRGYGMSQLHLVSDSCHEKIFRYSGDSVLPKGLKIEVLRISATGWEGFILKGLKAGSDSRNCNTIVG